MKSLTIHSLVHLLVFILLAENTRAAYPIEYIPNAKIPCVGPHPKNVILLACDAFGVLPPVSKLSLAQTMYHFISGYTALVPHNNLYIYLLCETNPSWETNVYIYLWCFFKSGCGHRGRRQRATGNILCLFRGSIYNAPPYQVCCNAGWEDAEVWGNRMACQHWLVWWKVWNIDLWYSWSSLDSWFVSTFLKSKSVFSSGADMAWAIASSCPTQGESSMLYTLAAF